MLGPFTLLIMGMLVLLLEICEIPPREMLFYGIFVKLGFSLSSQS